MLMADENRRFHSEPPEGHGRECKGDFSTVIAERQSSGMKGFFELHCHLLIKRVQELAPVLDEV